MRTIWTILSVLAIANLLAIIGFVGWLATSDRLNLDRVRKLREVMSVTLTSERVQAEEAQAALDAEAAAAAQAEKDAQPPITAEDQLMIQLESRQVDQQRLRRTADEIERLKQGLRAERLALEAERARFAAEREEFLRAQGTGVGEADEAQFKKALATLEGLKPDKAKAILNEIMSDPETGPKEVVEYLNAMQERVRTKVLEEFGKSDPALAADLLQRLRNRGVIASTGGAAP